MKVKNLIGRKYNSLSKDEKQFYDEVRDKYEINVCDATNIICFSCDLVWGVCGFEAISIEALEEMEVSNG